MKYPRTCTECLGTFAHQQSYHRHKKMGRCDRRVEASKIVNQTVINNITNNIQIIFPDAKEIDSQLFGHLSPQDRRCVKDAIDILKHSGIHGYEQTKEYIDQNFITVDQFEEKIKSCPVPILRVALTRMQSIAQKQHDAITKKNEQLNDKQLKNVSTTNKEYQERIDAAVETIFERLLESDDGAVNFNANSLSSIPLHITQDGDLKGWSRSNATCCWLKVQPRRVWNKIIVSIIKRFFEETRDVCSKSAEWYDKCEEGMIDNDDLIKRLRKNIEERSRQPMFKGWYSLTNEFSRTDTNTIPMHSKKALNLFDIPL